MDKEERKSATALFALCFVFSWSWVIHRIHPLSFYTSIFSLFITALAFYAMWRIVQHVAKNSGWKQIGIVSNMEPSFMALRYPLYLQAILDVNLIITLLTAAYLDGFQSFFMSMLDLCVIFFIFRKWHDFYKNHPIASLRSL